MSTYKVGDRIKLTSMPNDDWPIPVGSKGTITQITEGPLGQIFVDWDCKRSLILVPGVDRFETIMPENVREGFLAVRDSGLTNMLDRPRVASIANDLGFYEAADWINERSNQATYARTIFNGFGDEVTE